MKVYIGGTGRPMPESGLSLPYLYSLSAAVTILTTVTSFRTFSIWASLIFFFP